MKKRPELLLWRSKYWRFGLRRPWHWYFLGSLFLFIASMTAYGLLNPALRDGSVALREGTAIYRMHNPEFYWPWVALYLLFVAGSLAGSIWSFRGAVFSHRCVLCDKSLPSHAARDYPAS